MKKDVIKSMKFYSCECTNCNNMFFNTKNTKFGICPSCVNIERKSQRQYGYNKYIGIQFIKGNEEENTCICTSIYGIGFNHKLDIYTIEELTPIILNYANRYYKGNWEKLNIINFVTKIMFKYCTIHTKYDFVSNIDYVSSCLKHDLGCTRLVRYCFDKCIDSNDYSIGVSYYNLDDLMNMN